MNENKIYDITLQHPSRFIIYGPSGSGKSSFVEKILLYMNNLFGFDFEKIIYCSGQVFPNFDYVNNKKVIKIQTLDKDILMSIDEKQKNIIIIDDNMHVMTNDILISDLFTKISHHKNITVVLILQNLFPKSKYMRDISSNSTYIVLMSNPRETLQVKTLSTQIDGANQNFILNCYIDATKGKPFSYLFLDFDQNTPDELRVRTNIFPDESPKYVYVKIPQIQ
jgi:GTPase SAR1 family protein